MEEQKKVLNEQADDEMEIDLVQLSVEFFRAAKKWWWLFVSLVVIGIAGLYGFYYARYSPLYRCEATFTVSTGENSSFYYSANAADQMSKTFPYVLDSGYFRSVLLEALGTEQLNGTISAETIENSNMVTMVVESPSAEDARSILEASLEVYPEVSRFVLGEIELHLIDEIQTPTAPYNQPSRRRIVLFGGLGGLLLASAITLAAVLLNNTLKTTEDMERFSSLECLGALPDIKQKARKNSAASRYVSVLDPRTPHGFRESMGSLDIRLRAAMREREVKTLLVTSSVAGEGKSTVAINLAEQLAQDGKRVLLVDLDLRSQRDSLLLGIEDGVSAADVLRDPNFKGDHFVRYCKDHGFYFWGGRKKEANPVALLGDPRLREILRQLRSQVDCIIIDTPPCGLFQDAAVLADFADAILLVVRYGTVTVSNVKEALSMLNAAQTPVLGYIFNAYPQVISHYGYGRYGYGRYGYGKYGSDKYGDKGYGADLTVESSGAAE